MGLGKTFQSIAIIWTLLKQGLPKSIEGSGHRNAQRAADATATNTAAAGSASTVDASVSSCGGGVQPSIDSVDTDAGTTETTINREPQERMCKKVIVVCPTCLIGNWDNEINKWLAGKIRTCPLESGPHVDKNIRGFLGHYAMSPQVLIMSYETFLRCERS
jgi:SNF2 family DNA or RNA helicase